MHPMLRNVGAVALVGCGVYLLLQQIACVLGSSQNSCSITGAEVVGEVMMIALGLILLRHGPVLTDDAEVEEI